MVEEAVVDADGGQSQHLGEEPAQQFLARTARLRPDAVARKSGAGSASRSSFPLAVVGSASRTITAAGTMWSGSFSRAYARSAAESRPASRTTEGRLVYGRGGAPAAGRYTSVSGPVCSGGRKSTSSSPWAPSPDQVTSVR